VQDTLENKKKRFSIYFK